MGTNTVIKFGRMPVAYLGESRGGGANLGWKELILILESHGAKNFEFLQCSLLYSVQRVGEQ